MELNKNQIARVTCKDLEGLVKASNNSKQVLKDFTDNNDKYTWDIKINHDELYYDLYLYDVKNLN